MSKSNKATALHFMRHCVLKNDRRTLIFERSKTGKHKFVEHCILLCPNTCGWRFCPLAILARLLESYWSRAFLTPLARTVLCQTTSPAHLMSSSTSSLQAASRWRRQCGGHAYSFRTKTMFTEMTISLVLWCSTRPHSKEMKAYLNVKRTSPRFIFTCP